MRRLTLTVAALTLLAIVPLATAQKPQTPSHHHLAGAVTAVGSNSITVSVLIAGKRVSQLVGQTATIVVSSTTQITTGKTRQAAQLSSIQVGDLVGLGVTSANADLSALTAVRIHVSCNCHWIGGKVAAVGTTSMTVHVARTGPFDSVLRSKDVTLQLN